MLTFDESYEKVESGHPDVGFFGRESNQVDGFKVVAVDDRERTILGEETSDFVSLQDFRILARSHLADALHYHCGIQFVNRVLQQNATTYIWLWMFSWWMEPIESC